MSISQTLANANSGLVAVARRASVTSNNIANALTPGYSRRDVALAEQTIAGTGAGVRVAGVSRATAPAVTAERRIADASLANNAARAEAAARLSGLIGGPEDAGGLVARYAAFETALRALADSPQSGAAQLHAAAAARELATTFNRIADQQQAIRQGADAEIARGVASANAALAEIDALNLSIVKGRASGADVAALEDQRQKLIDGVNEFIPVRELARGDGALDLITSEGVYVIAGSAGPIEFAAAGLMTAQAAYDGGAGSLSGLMIGDVDVTPRGPGAQQVKSGAAAGLFAVRDEIVPQASRQLDALAADLINRFSDPSVDPTLAAGAPGLFTDAGGSLNAAPGLAGRLSLNALVDPSAGGDAAKLRDGLGSTAPGPAGDDTLIRNLIGAFTASATQPAALGAARDLNPAEAAAFIASTAAVARADAEAAQSFAAAFAQGLSEAELLQTGVDTDRELQNLLIIEQAYAANARVIEAVSEMMDALMRI
ncbi:MAG: flagellar hook-associated protein FlgK [Parvularculaceae bacterium]